MEIKFEIVITLQKSDGGRCYHEEMVGIMETNEWLDI